MATRIEGFFKDGTYAVGIGDYVVGTAVTDKGAVVKRWINDIYRIHHRRLHRLVVRVSDWDARRLTQPQIMYACADAFVSFEVGRMLYDGEY
ncbi:hypothetical protein PR202_gb04835 [Eleusine coracana subsp. coracana]|uniref:Uncharacterized protein n=1 Tax=Eleusine coracana subsp. coracana TaxID=191504 RepID=A0AAV5E3W1_ELECO|nr:hypothetical protein PR202_gb04835 [Eleusine coracana subsp. coracana]